MSNRLETVILSDFNVDVLAGLMRNDSLAPLTDVDVAPFGQVMSVMLNPADPIWAKDVDNVLLWTQPRGVIESFNAVANYEMVDVDKVLAEVEQFADAVIQMSARVKNVFVSSWTMPTFNRGWGLLDSKHDFGLNNILLQMNLKLSFKFAEYSNIHIFNTNKWIESSGSRSFNSKLWYMGKIPFDTVVFKSLIKDFKAGLAGIYGQARKCIILDLDDTLWGGIVGDAGWEKLKLGGHDPIGESFAEFQKTIKSYKNRGIILGIVSKNTESVALEAIKNNPEMILDIEDFAGWRINWEDKAKNIAELAQELNIGLQSVVFIDDNPVERGRVQDALPEVFVPEWPKDKTLYTQTLQALDCFDNPHVTQEDQKRAEMYALENKRQETKTQVGSLDDWLKSLEIKVSIENLKDNNLQRTVQLLNKTNQMNLSTRRMSEAEFVDWSQSPENKTWVLRVADKFGDSGLTGIVSVEEDDNTLKIVDFILSCRVFGRRIENVMLNIAYDYAQKKNMQLLYAPYVETEKNKPTKDFFESSECVFNDELDVYELEVGSIMETPEGITVEYVDVQSPSRISEFVDK